MQGRKSIFTIFVSILFIGSIQSQNLVPNPSFEHFSTPPSRDGNFSVISSWNSASGRESRDYKYGTPDFFHSKGINSAQLPITQMGTIFAKEGEGVVGIVTYNGDSPNFREYIYTRLLTKMVPGEGYTISFSIYNGFKNQYGRFASNGIGILFSKSPVKQTTNEVIRAEPQIILSEPVCSDTWITKSLPLFLTNLIPLLR